MKALVLGGNGFIGSHLVDHLLDKGHSVRVFDRGPEKYRAPITDVDYCIGNFDDLAKLAEALEGIDIVYHLISTTVPSTSNKEPVYDIESNLICTVRLLELMKKANISRLVYLSSGGTVYGVPTMSTINENHILKPICSYGVVKVAVENYIHMYHHLYDLEYVILRVSNPYGERQGKSGVQGVIGTFLNKVHSSETIEVWGDGSVVRDFIYISDLAEISVRVGESSVTGVFNIGSGMGHSIKEIIDSISIVTKREVTPKYSSSRSYDVPKVVLDISKAKESFSWKANTTLVDGLAKTWHWMNK